MKGFPVSKRCLSVISEAAQNAKIIDRNAPDLPQKLRDSFLKLSKTGNVFRSVNLLKGRRSHPWIYGGQVVAHALKAAEETVNSNLSPHSMHSYFIKAGAVDCPVDYEVELTRDGGSFANRRVQAIQNGQLLFTAQLSFTKSEQGSFSHAASMSVPEGPDNLKSTRTLMKEMLNELNDDHQLTTKMFLAYKLAEFPPTFHKIFEARPVDQDFYRQRKTVPAHETEFTLWIKPLIPIGDDYALQRLMAAYISDSSMVETAIVPHIGKGFVPGMAFSLDHCMWFHETNFSKDKWMLWEQKSDFAGSNRVITRGRLFTPDGKLVMTAMQEGLARAYKE